MGPLSILILLSIFMVTVTMVLCALYIAQQRFQMSDRAAQSSAAAGGETAFEESFFFKLSIICIQWNAQILSVLVNQF